MEYKFELQDDKEYRENQTKFLQKFKRYSAFSSNGRHRVNGFLFVGFIVFVLIWVFYSGKLVEDVLAATNPAIDSSSKSLIKFCFHLLGVFAILWILLKLSIKLCAGAVARDKPFEFSLNDDGVLTISDQSKTLYYWNAIEFAYSDPRGFYIQVPLGAIWMDNRYFKNTEEKSALARFVLDHVPEEIREKILANQPDFIVNGT